MVETAIRCSCRCLGCGWRLKEGAWEQEGWDKESIWSGLEEDGGLRGGKDIGGTTNWS